MTARVVACVPAMAVLLALAACGGTGPTAGSSQGPPPGPPPAVARFSQELAREHGMLLPAIRADRRARGAVLELRSHQAYRGRAVHALRSAAAAFDVAALRLAPAHGSVPSLLVVSCRRAASALRLLTAGLRDSDPDAVIRARRGLVRAAHQSTAWSERVVAQAGRLGLDGPRWPSQLGRGLRLLGMATGPALVQPLGPGAAGAGVSSLQRRLAALGYLPPGYRTGVYDDRTTQAVIAFQGWTGLSRDGVAGSSTLTSLNHGTRPQPWSTATRHIEIHIPQQVLLLVMGGRTVRAIHVSTGAPGHPTPRGTFTIYRKERMSWSVPFQVWMPYASYFTGGYAIHEYRDVPPYPASHGCVRVPAGESLAVWDFASLGTPVTID